MLTPRVSESIRLMDSDVAIENNRRVLNVFIRHGTIGEEIFSLPAARILIAYGEMVLAGKAGNTTPEYFSTPDGFFVTVAAGREGW